MGQYDTANKISVSAAFVPALNDAYNGNWFGPMHSSPDSTTAKFSVHFRNIEGEVKTAEVHSGRYTPKQLAQAIEDEIDFMPIKVEAVFDCETFKGLSFRYNAIPALPFSLEFSTTTDPTTPPELPPGHIGYRAARYSGCTHYEPEIPVRWFPRFYQGDRCDSTTSLPCQTYLVEYDEKMRKLVTRARAFSTLTSVSIVDQGANVVTLETPIAHGAQPGQRVVLSGTATRVGIVLASSNPRHLKVQYGGDNITYSGDVVINFTCKTWNLNTVFSVKDCILRAAYGVDAAFYVMDEGVNTFEAKSAKLVVFNGLTLLSPNCIQLFPFEYVFVMVTFNHKDGEGVTMGIQTKKHGEEVNGSVIHALARIPIGRFSPESHSDAFDRHYEIQSIGVSKISSIRIQILNPDLTYYRSHGKHISVGLLLNVVGERFLTTQ